MGEQRQILDQSATSQGTTGKGHQELEEAWKDPPQGPSEGVRPCQHLHFKLLPSKAMNHILLSQTSMFQKFVAAPN